VLQCVSVCCSVLQCAGIRQLRIFFLPNFTRSIEFAIWGQVWRMRCLQTLQHTVANCNTLQHTATHCNTLQHTETHCNTLQHTATHCNTMQHTSTHCNTPQHTVKHSKHCNTRQHTATHCNTLQHTATHWCGDEVPNLTHVSLHYLYMLLCRIVSLLNLTTTHSNIL